jgi:hypothetical protein
MWETTKANPVLAFAFAFSPFATCLATASGNPDQLVAPPPSHRAESPACSPSPQPSCAASSHLASDRRVPVSQLPSEKSPSAAPVPAAKTPLGVSRPPSLCAHRNLAASNPASPQKLHLVLFFVPASVVSSCFLSSIWTSRFFTFHDGINGLVPTQLELPQNQRLTAILIDKAGNSAPPPNCSTWNNLCFTRKWPILASRRVRVPQVLPLRPGRRKA